MDVRNCPRCGKIFNRVRRDICPACAQKEDSDYETVRDYIYENPKVDVQTVSEETGIPVETIMKFLREDRLVNLSGIPVLHCDTCGTGIPSGRFCDPCKAKLEKELNKTGFKGYHRNTGSTGDGSFHFMRDRVNKKR